MLKIENVEVFGWEAAIRGMRNPKNSWDKSDSWWASADEAFTDEPLYIVGEADLKLMKLLAGAGNDHGKFMRMINVTLDINAPLYWWKEFDTYKVGTVADSCSTMHKIHAKVFEMNDFSHEHLYDSSLCCLEETIEKLNFLENKIHYTIEKRNKRRRVCFRKRLLVADDPASSHVLQSEPDGATELSGAESYVPRPEESQA